MTKTLIVIGAGIAGLSAGIYAQLNGFKTTLFEMHDKPGGYCTAWSRKGFTFDYSIHNLVGTAPGTQLRKMWDELGALDGANILNHPEFVRVESPDGRSFTVYGNIARTGEELRRVSPEDEELVRDYERTARKVADMDPFAMLASESKLGMLKALPRLPLLMRLIKRSMADYGQEFTDPFLKRAFPVTQYGIADIPLAIHFIFVGGMDRGDLGWPRGGSLAFARNMERRFVELGGEVRFRNRVDKILVRDDRAVGVRLEDGTEHYADAVISAADGRSTIFDMLDGRYVNDVIRDYYTSGWEPELMDFGLQVAMGVDRDLVGEPHALSMFLDEPIDVDGRPRDRLDLELYSSETGMAPEGKGVIKAIFSSSYDHWRTAKAEGRYEGEKRRVADAVLSRLEGRFPGLKEQVEVVDVCTMLTAERFTANYHGMQAWGHRTAQKQVSSKGLSRTLPGLDAFYMAGQWAEATIGLQTAALSGRRAVRNLCKDEGIKFVSGR